MSDPMDALDELDAAVKGIFARYRESLAAFMIEHGFSTGHGDTFADLLRELSWQIKELQQKAKEKT